MKVFDVTLKRARLTPTDAELRDLAEWLYAACRALNGCVHGGTRVVKVAALTLIVRFHCYDIRLPALPALPAGLDDTGGQDLEDAHKEFEKAVKILKAEAARRIGEAMQECTSSIQPG